MSATHPRWTSHHLSQHGTLRSQGIGCRVWGLGLRFLVFVFWGLGFRFRVSGLGFWVSGFGFRVQGLGTRFRVQGAEFRLQGTGYRDLLWTSHDLQPHGAPTWLGAWGLGLRVEG